MIVDIVNVTHQIRIICIIYGERTFTDKANDRSLQFSKYTVCGTTHFSYNIQCTAFLRGHVKYTVGLYSRHRVGHGRAGRGQRTGRRLHARQRVDGERPRAGHTHQVGAGGGSGGGGGGQLGRVAARVVRVVRVMWRRRVQAQLRAELVRRRQRARQQRTSAQNLRHRGHHRRSDMGTAEENHAEVCVAERYANALCSWSVNGLALNIIKRWYGCENRCDSDQMNVIQRSPPTFAVSRNGPVSYDNAFFFFFA